MNNQLDFPAQYQITVLGLMVSGRRPAMHTRWAVTPTKFCISRFHDCFPTFGRFSRVFPERCLFPTFSVLFSQDKVVCHYPYWLLLGLKGTLRLCWVSVSWNITLSFQLVKAFYKSSLCNMCLCVCLFYLHVAFWH